MAQKLIVMGPEEHDSSGDLLRAPKFTSITDKYQYRRDVREWYDYVMSSAECGSSKAKSVAANLGRSLRARMDDRYKGIIDSALRTGRIRFKNKHGCTRLSAEEQITSVEAILQLIAKDSMNDRIQRVVKMSRDVYSCKRLEKESFQDFATRFQEVADAFLSYTRSGSSQVNELNFAMICLENARMNLTTYNHTVDNLIAKAQNDKASPVAMISTEDVICVRNQVNNAVNAISAMISDLPSTDQTDQDGNNLIEEKMTTVKGLLMGTIESIDAASKSENDDETDGANLHITLDQTLATLRNMKSHPTDAKTSTALNSARPDMLIKEKEIDPSDVLKKLGTMMSGHRPSIDRPSGDRSHNRFHAKKRKQNKLQGKRNAAFDSNDGTSEDLDPSDLQVLKKARTIIEQWEDSNQSTKRVRFGSGPPKISPRNTNRDNEPDPFFQKPQGSGRN